MKSIEEGIQIKNSPTVNLSCRINKNIHDQLIEEAAKKGISLNSLVNSISKQYVGWNKYANEIGFIPITRRMLGKIFKHLNDEDIDQIAKELGGNVTKEMVFLTYNEMSFENLIPIIEINSMRFGIVKHSEKDGKHSINIHHGINNRFSRFLATSHQAMADELSFKLTIKNMDDSMFCMEIENPK